MRISTTAALLLLTSTSVVAQGPAAPPRTVADGLYTDAQADRGAASYEAACARCHRSDLGGADGPALRDDRFNRMFAGKPLHSLYDRVSATMPRNAPASLAEGVYVDILAYLLRENGFPAGVEELVVDAVEGVEMRPTQPRPSPVVGNYSYVEVSGCLAQAPDGAWLLEQASDPIAVRPVVVTSVSRSSAPTTSPRSGQTFHLLDAIAYQPERHRGQRLRLRGTLIRLPSQQRLTISSAETLGTVCR